MKQLWGRLEAWAQKQGQSLRLRSGVTERSITAAEKQMKLQFPDDMRESLLLFDGQDSALQPLMWSPGCGYLATLEEIVAQHAESVDDAEEYESPDEPKATDAGKSKKQAQDGGRIRNVLFDAKRIPIAGAPYFDGDVTYIDLDPGPKGVCGQIITLTSECDFIVLGSTLREHLTSYIEALESGELVLSAENDVVPKGDRFWQEHPGGWLASHARRRAATTAAKAPKKPRAKAGAKAHAT